MHTILDFLISISIITEALGLEYDELVYDILQWKVINGGLKFRG